MGYICLLRLQCKDGDIQLVVGSEKSGIMENFNLKTLSSVHRGVVSTKVNALLKLISNSGILEDDDLTGEHCDENSEEQIYNGGNDNGTDSESDSHTNVHSCDTNVLSNQDQDDNEDDIKKQTENRRVSVEDCDIAFQDVTVYQDGESVEFLKFETEDDKVNDNYEIKNVSDEDDNCGPMSHNEYLKSIAPDQPCKCAHCKELFGECHELQQHIFKMHYKEHSLRRKPLFSCKYCDKEIYSSRELSCHLGSHRRLYKCTHRFCHKSYSTNKELQEHIRNGCSRSAEYKLRPAIHACKLCDQKFTKIVALKFHMKEHTNTGTSKLAKYVCGVCKKTFPVLELARAHARDQHGYNYRATQQKQQNYECSDCGKLFGLRIDCRRHVERFHADRERTVLCTICNKAFFNEFDCNRHVKRMHQVDN